MIPYWDPSAPVDPNEWVYASNPWDCLTLGGEQIPGIVECVTKAKLATLKSKPAGKHGARLTSTGKDPQEAQIKVYLSNRRQWERWQQVRPKIYSGDRKDFLALDAIAPAFTDAGVKSIAIESIESPAPGRSPGERLILCIAREYAPPSKKKATKTPASSVQLRPEFKDANFTAPDGKQINVTPANARQSPPSESRRARGP